MKSSRSKLRSYLTDRFLASACCVGLVAGCASQLGGADGVPSAEGEDSGNVIDAAGSVPPESTDPRLGDSSPAGELPASEEAPPVEAFEPEAERVVEPFPSTPLARLTNEEFLGAVQTLLGLPADAPALEAARRYLASEPEVGGLVNHASGQQLTQLALAGYSAVAEAATDAFLEGVETLADLEGRLDCEQLKLSGGLAESDEFELPSCFAGFTSSLLERAFRREVGERELSQVTEAFEQLDELLQANGRSPGDLPAYALKLKTLLRFSLTSPDFLLIVERGLVGDVADPDVADPDEPPNAVELRPNEIATRMSLLLTGTLPDAELLADAQRGELSDAGVRLGHVDRLLDSAPGRAQLSRVLSGWLGIDPGAEEQALTTLDDFVLDWISENRSLGDLYTAPIGVQHVDGTETVEPFGVLGLSAFVGSHTSFPTPSFITRGVFVTQRLLCASLPDDIPAEALDGGELSPVEVFVEHTKQPCASCHRVFDNYGAAFQRFDPETNLYDPQYDELGTSFELFELGDVSGSVATLSDLGAILANSSQASDCMAELMYRNARRRQLDVTGGDTAALEKLASDWASSPDVSLRSLLRDVVASDDFGRLFL